MSVLLPCSRERDQAGETSSYDILLRPPAVERPYLLLGGTGSWELRTGLTPIFVPGVERGPDHFGGKVTQRPAALTVPSEVTCYSTSNSPCRFPYSVWLHSCAQSYRDWGRQNLPSYLKSRCLSLFLALQQSCRKRSVLPACISATVTFFPSKLIWPRVVILNCWFLPASVWFGVVGELSHNPHLVCESQLFVAQTFGTRLCVREGEAFWGVLEGRMIKWPLFLFFCNGLYIWGGSFSYHFPLCLEISVLFWGHFSFVQHQEKCIWVITGLYPPLNFCLEKKVLFPHCLKQTVFHFEALVCLSVDFYLWGGCNKNKNLKKCTCVTFLWID